MIRAPASSLRLALPLAASLLVPAARAGEGCKPGWDPLLGTPGIRSEVHSVAAYDDGTGAVLFAGDRSGTLWRWGGDAWIEVDTGVGFSRIEAMIVFDDGTGPALYVAGAGPVMRWDGVTWSSASTPGIVYALAVFDDGTGPALYAGGSFPDRLARWNGSSWTSVGGPSDTVLALAAHDDGSGPALYVGGQFASAGGVLSSGIARWDGTSWSSVAGGTDRAVRALVVHDEGGGPMLYAGGLFDFAGGVGALRVARWDGTAWWSLGFGCADDVWALAVHDDGGGPRLYVGCDTRFCSTSTAGSVRRWDGSAWAALGPFTSGIVRGLASFDDGSGPRLVAGGSFSSIGDVPAQNVGAWDGAAWSTLGRGVTDRVKSLAVWDDGSGPALYFGGEFLGAGGIFVNRIARWDGSTVSALGDGVSWTNSTTQTISVDALAAYDNGSGSALFAGGHFRKADGMFVEHIARWDGSAWSAVGGGVDDLSGRVLALAAFDDGTGNALYVGGTFSSVGGTGGAGRIARWNGASWSHLGTGVAGPSFDRSVHALRVFDDGSGPALCVAGQFASAGGVPANGVARWTSAGWSAMGGGLTSTSTVRALAVWDDGTGPALYVGGQFSTGSGGPDWIARWDGTSWQALSMESPLRDIYAMVAFDDGNGSSLFVAGTSPVTGSQRLVRWDGTTWWAFAGPLSETNALMPYDDGSGPALYVGGRSLSTAATDDTYLARWRGCPTEPHPAFCDASDGSLASCPCAPGNPDSGCDLPQATGGVRLDVLAQTTSPNGATLRGTGFNASGNAAAVVIRSTSLDPASPVVFGDGLRCVNSTPLVRLAAAQSVGGVSTHAFGHGAAAGAGTFYYQLWFRSNPSTYCDAGAAFNLSSGRALTW